MSIGLSYILTQTSRARRLTIKVDGQGQVVVTAPKYVPKYKIAEFVESARTWIETQKQVQQTKPVLLSANTCYFFGVEYPVKVSSRCDGTVKVGKAVIIVAPTEVTAQATVSLLNAWLKNRAIEYVTERAFLLSATMQLPFAGLAFKQQKTRWGSCSSRKHLNFNWKLIHAPKEVIEYVIIHELAHTKEMNHGKRFWDLVSRYDPDHMHHRRWLQRFGSTAD